MKRATIGLFASLLGASLLVGQETARSPLEIPGLLVRVQVGTFRGLFQQIVPCRIVDTRLGGKPFNNESRSYGVTGPLTCIGGDGQTLPRDLVVVALRVTVFNAEPTPLAGAFSVNNSSVGPAWFGWFGQGKQAGERAQLVQTYISTVAVNVSGARADVTVDLLGYFLADTP